MWVGAAALLVLGFTALFTLLQDPIFEARTTLRIEDRSGASASPDLLSALSGPSTVETEMEILRSRSVMEDVVAALRLHVPAAALREAIRVTRPQPNAAIVSVAYEAADPTVARDVANAVARSYIARRNQMQKRQAQAAVEFLDEQVESIGGQLRAAEEAFERYRKARFVVDPEAQATEQVRRLAELRARRDEVEVERGALRALLDRARGAGAASAWAAFAGSPALLRNEAIGGILQQLTDVETQRSHLLARRTPEDPDVAALEATLGLLEARLAALAENQLRALDEHARSLDVGLARFDARLQEIPEVELEYARLRRHVDLLGQLYTLLQTRLKEAQIAEAVEIANVQVVDPAILPTEPVRPRTIMNLVFGLLAGLLFGGIVGMVREMGDSRVRSRDEVAELTALPLLAAIPRIESVNGGNGGLAGRIEARLVTRHAPRSPAAEAYRALRTSLAFSGTARDRRIKTIVFTSPEPLDGKTTTAANLAVTLAEQGLRVLLLESDQRRPLLHRVFHVERRPGLTDVLVGEASLDAVLRRVELPEYAAGSLDFIAGGTPVPNPAELIGSAAMKMLLADLSKRYDAVLLDTPPLNVVTDAAVAGTLADGVIVVARMGATHRESLRRAVEDLERVGARVVGTVLNDAHEREDRYGYRYVYEYHDGDGRNGTG